MDTNNRKGKRALKNNEQLTRPNQDKILNLFKRKFRYDDPGQAKDLFKTTNFSHTQTDTWEIQTYMDMKSKMNELKCRLNDKDVIQWHVHTKRVNPARKIVLRILRSFRPDFCTQAWCKFYEIACNYLHIDTCMPYFSVHLCEAPGAFIASLNHYLHTIGYKGSWRWLATTLNTYYEGNNIGEMIEDDRFISETYENWYFGVDNTGNLMSSDNMEGLKEVLKDVDVNLVTADGSVDCQREPAEQENIVSWLQHCETLTALQILSPGGTFVLKMFTMYECRSVCLMYLLNCVFKEVQVFKPCSSKGGNSEVYVVCLNYRGRQLYSDFLDRLVPVYFSKEKPAGCLFRKSDIPESFFRQHTECVKFFMEHQKTSIERNLDLYEKLNEDKLAELSLEQDLCETTFFEIYKMKPLVRAKRLLKTVKAREDQYKIAHRLEDSGETNYAKKVKLDGRLTGSLLERQQTALLPWRQKVKVFETYEEDIGDTDSWSCWIVNKKETFKENDVRQLEFVTGLRIAAIQNSRFCHNKLVGQVREILQNVQWLSNKLERELEVVSLTITDLKNTVELCISARLEISSKVAVDLDRDMSDQFEDTEDSENCLKENHGVKDSTETCFRSGFETPKSAADKLHRDISDSLEKSHDMEQCAKDKNNVGNDFRNGQAQLLSRNPESYNGNSTDEIISDCVSVHANSSCFFHGFVKKVKIDEEMKNKVCLYSSVSETVVTRFELDDQLKLLESVIAIVEKCAPGDLVVLEMGSCLTRITAGLVYILYKSFYKIGFLHHHGNFFHRHLVCVSYQSCPIELVEFLRTVYKVMFADQSEAVLEIIPIMVLLKDEEFVSFLHSTNTYLLQSFITTVIKRERNLLCVTEI